MTVLVVGATGSIGRLVVAEALRQGHAVRALVRNLARAPDAREPLVFADADCQPHAKSQRSCARIM